MILGEVHDNPGHHAQSGSRSRGPATACAGVRNADVRSGGAPARGPQRRGRGRQGDRLGQPPAGRTSPCIIPIFTAAPKARVFGGDLPRGRRAPRGQRRGCRGLRRRRRALRADDTPCRRRPGAARGRPCRPPIAMPCRPSCCPAWSRRSGLRDAALARAVVKAMDATGGPVAVITGNGHARRDQGIPAVLAAAAPDLTVLSIGQIEGPVGTGAALRPLDRHRHRRARRSLRGVRHPDPA